MPTLCPACQTQLPDDAAFCYKCGQTVAAAKTEDKPNPRFCLACGVLLRDDASFCLACGAAVSTDTTFWMRKRKDEVEEAIVTPFATNLLRSWEKVLDFEEHKHEIQYRAMKLAEYYGTLLSATDWFELLFWLGWLGIIPSTPFGLDPWNEFTRFYTNKPNTHKALFQRTMIETYISEARRRRYIDVHGNFSPTVLAYLNLTKFNNSPSDDPIRFTEFDFSELDGLAKKDDELFPPPEHLRVEVAGTVLNFTTDEGVLVVYMDSAHKGKTANLSIPGSAFWLDNWPDPNPFNNAEIIERTIGNAVVSAAIFNHIPFVTNKLRHQEKVLTQVDGNVRFYGSKPEWEQKVSIVRGQVVELDWRGRKA